VEYKKIFRHTEASFRDSVQDERDDENSIAQHNTMFDNVVVCLSNFTIIVFIRYYQNIS